MLIKCTGIFNNVEMVVMAKKFKARRDFDKERKMLELIRATPHANVIDFIDISYQHRGYIFFRLPACNLAQYVTNKEPKFLCVEEAKKVFVQVGSGLDHLHSKLKIAHLNINPSNILVTHNCYVRLADLSCAEKIGDEVDAVTPCSPYFEPHERFAMYNGYIEEMSLKVKVIRKTDGFMLAMTLLKEMFGADIDIQYFYKPNVGIGLPPIIQDSAFLINDENNLAHLVQVKEAYNSIFKPILEQNPDSRPNIKSFLSKKTFEDEKYELDRGDPQGLLRLNADITSSMDQTIDMLMHHNIKDKDAYIQTVARGENRRRENAEHGELETLRVNIRFEQTRAQYYKNEQNDLLQKVREKNLKIMELEKGNLTSSNNSNNAASNPTSSRVADKDDEIARLKRELAKKDEMIKRLKIQTKDIKSGKVITFDDRSRTLLDEIPIYDSSYEPDFHNDVLPTIEPETENVIPIVAQQQDVVESQDHQQQQQLINLKDLNTSTSSSSGSSSPSDSGSSSSSSDDDEEDEPPKKRAKRADEEEENIPPIQQHEEEEELPVLITVKGVQTPKLIK